MFDIFKHRIALYKRLEGFEKRELRHMLMFCIAMFGVLSLLLLTAFAHNITALVVLNVASLLAYLCILLLVTQQNVKSAVIAMTFTNLILVTIHTIFFGTSAGFQIFMWPIICVFATSTRVGVSFARTIATLTIGLFISLQYFVPAKTEYLFFEHSQALFIAISGVLFVSAITSMSSSVSKRRKKLERLANRDNLTDLYNRRFFTSFLNYQLAVALREKRSFTLAMADIDLFKSINDTHGHDVGDNVLKSVAQCFNVYLAQHDAVCRWGGEEFLIFLPESKVEQAEPVIQAIASVISDHGSANLQITMSFGLVESDGNESLDEILQRVDALMYQAKSQGRDNIQTTLL